MNIVISGCSSGIGYETALAFARMGNHKVFGLARRAELLQKLENKFKTTNPKAEIKTCVFDLAVGDYENLAKEIEVYFRNEKIDILINNAGLLIKKDFEELSDEDWERSLKVNFLSNVKIIRSLLPKMNRQEGSHIVNIGSMAGIPFTEKFPGLSAYSAAKGAVNFLTESLSVEFQDYNIRINSVNPGAVQTDMLQQAFPGYNAEVSAEMMGGYIARFSIENKDIMNGRIIQASFRS